MFVKASIRGTTVYLPLRTFAQIRKMTMDSDFVMEFVRANCHPIPGATILLRDFAARFVHSLKADERPAWKKSRIVAAMRAAGIVYGGGSGNQRVFGNISWWPDVEPRLPLEERDGKVRRVFPDWCPTWVAKPAEPTVAETTAEATAL